MGDLAAGEFGAWLSGIERALAGADSEVPCGDCSACCSASQFIHIGPDETETLAHIPAELLFPAPASAEGIVLLGYDESGRCPLLDDGLCSIYEHRPRTCRVYDCRVFPATGIKPDKSVIAEQVERWRFSDSASPQHDTLLRAARWLEGHREELIVTGAVTDATRVAVSAIRIRRLFTDGEPAIAEVVDALSRA